MDALTLPLRVMVFGPASGAIAFGYPDGQRVNDDSVFLPSSAFSLEAGRSAVRLSRHERAREAVVRLGVYRQIYEPGMSRLGHCFGVVFEFGSNVPSGAVALKTIGQLVDLVEGHCCRAGTFCDYRTFVSFLNEEIEPSFDGIRDQLESGPTGKALVPLTAIPQQRFHLELGPDESLAPGLVDWFFVDPGSAACEDLIASPAGSGQPGSGYRSVRGEADISRECLRFVYQAALDSAAAAEAAQSRERTLEDEVRQLRGENLRYRETYERLERSFERSRVTIGMNDRPDRDPARRGTNLAGLPPAADPRAGHGLDPGRVVRRAAQYSDDAAWTRPFSPSGMPSSRLRRGIRQAPRFWPKSSR